MKSLSDSSILENYPLAPLTSWKCGGRARYYAVAKDRESLCRLDEFAAQEGLKTLVIGTGTNLLVADEGVNAVVVSLEGEFKKIAAMGDYIFCGTGATMGALQMFCMKVGLTGLEPCMGIPGTLGAAIVGNAGTPGGSVGGSIDFVDVYERGRGIRTLESDECGFVYRNSSLRGQIVLSACIRMTYSTPQSVRDNMLAALAKRRKHPHGRTAGSVFKNPAGDFAGRLIESAGLKGYRLGGAFVSPQHANFIVCDGDSSADIHALIEHCKVLVYNKFGVMLEPEVKFWGINESEQEV